MKDPKIIDIGPTPDLSNETARSAFFRPLSSRGFPRWLVFGLAIFGLIYVLNPTMGVFEIIPDFLPFIDNLDEGFAYILIMYGIIELVEGKK